MTSRNNCIPTCHEYLAKVTRRSFPPKTEVERLARETAVCALVWHFCHALTITPLAPLPSPPLPPLRSPPLPYLLLSSSPPPLPPYTMLYTSGGGWMIRPGTGMASCPLLDHLDSSVDCCSPSPLTPPSDILHSCVCRHSAQPICPFPNSGRALLLVVAGVQYEPLCG